MFAQLSLTSATDEMIRLHQTFLILLHHSESSHCVHTVFQDYSWPHCLSRTILLYHPPLDTMSLTCNRGGVAPCAAGSPSIGDVNKNNEMVKDKKRRKTDKAESNKNEKKEKKGKKGKHDDLEPEASPKTAGIILQDDLFGSRSPLPVCTPAPAHGLQAATSPLLDYRLQAASSPSLGHMLQAAGSPVARSVAETERITATVSQTVTPERLPAKAPDEGLPANSQLVAAVETHVEVLDDTRDDRLLPNSQLVAAEKAAEDVDGDVDLPMNAYKIDPAIRALVKQCNVPTDIDAKTRNTLYQALGRCMKKAQDGKLYIPPPVIARYGEAQKAGKGRTCECLCCNIAFLNF